jgi:zinc transport system permease protein
MMAASISHSILGGIGLFLYLNKTFDLPILTPILGAIVASFFFALIMGLIHLKLKDRQDIVLSCVWILGMSLGVLFLAKVPGYNVELVHFLFGNVLFANMQDLLFMLGLDFVLIVCFFFFYRQFNLYFFDESQAKLQKLNVAFWTLFLFVLIGLTTVMLIQVVGILLVIALLTFPAHLSSLFSKNLLQMVLFAFCFAFVFCLIGTFFALLLDLPIGASVAFISAILYLAVIKVRFKYA